MIGSGNCSITVNCPITEQTTAVYALITFEEIVMINLDLNLSMYFKCPISHFYQLALRTVSSSRSAYACFLFNESFFISYDDGSSDVPAGSQEEDLFKCKIAMKVSGITCTTKLTIKLLQERPDFLSP